MRTLAAVAAALVTGAALLGGCATPDAPTPPPLAAVPASTATGPAAPDLAAAPVRVQIPSIGVDSTLIRTGMLPDGTPEVPDVHLPGQASWATWSPEPGQPGPAVLYGHVDGEVDGRRGVPGVFNRLDELQPGALVEVDRAGADPVTFVVAHVDAFPKAELDEPGGMATAAVYGDTPGPQLRLITCGGSFDAHARSYLDQVVVFAHLQP